MVEVFLFYPKDGRLPNNGKGTAFWASERVLEFLAGEAGGGLTEYASKQCVNYILECCNNGFDQYIPVIIKQEYKKTVRLRWKQFRIAGFFHRGYSEFIAIDWWLKKKQQNDRRLNNLYRRVNAIAEKTQWTRIS